MKQEYNLYKKEDQLVWKTLFERQVENLEGKSCAAYLSCLEIMKGVLNAKQIPDFKLMNAKLTESTGWSIEVVPGLIPVEDFFRLLAQRKFSASTWVRKMNQLDYLILTSRNEGLPGVVLEASVLGVPCIVSKETNMGEYITQNEAGICLEQNTVATIALAMQTASNWKTIGRIKRVSKNAKQMIEKQFNWNTIVQNLEQLYV